MARNHLHGFFRILGSFVLLVIGSNSLAIEKSKITVTQIVNAYQLKCENQKEACFLSECDLKIKQCHPEKILLFRGTGTESTGALQSDFKKFCNQRESFCTQDAFSQSLKKLKWGVAQMQPTSKIPSENEELALVKRDGRWQWYYMWDENSEITLNRKFKNKVSDPKSILSVMQILFLTHQNGALLHFQNSTCELSSLDPFISFSADPRIAIQFAKEHYSFFHAENPQVTASPQLIVGSIAPEEFTSECNLFPKQPALFLDPKNCGNYQNFRELEFPAFYSVPEKDILMRFKLAY